MSFGLAWRGWWNNDYNNTFLCVQFGRTPLITAAREGWYDIVDMLLKTKDINVMKKDTLVSLSIERLS